MAKREGFAPSSSDRVKLAEVTGADKYPDEVFVDLNGKDPNAYEVEVVDDTPDEDRGRPTTLDYSLADQEEDLRDLSRGAQKRIDRLKFETNVERRAREEAERQRDEAVRIAQSHAQRVRELETYNNNAGSALAASMKERNEQALNNAQRALSQAHTDGDSDAIAQATADIGRLQAEALSIDMRTPRRDNTPAPTPQPQPQAGPQLAPKVENWIRRNNAWFGKNKEKTSKAMALHYDLEARGIMPIDEAYTRELDKGLKAVYPDHEPYDYPGDTDASRREPRRTDVVTEGSRVTEASSNPRRIVLTKTEMAIAKQLGITPQAYAAEKQKIAARGAGA